MHLFERNATSDLLDGSAIEKLREEYILNLRCKVSHEYENSDFSIIYQYSMRVSRECDSKHAAESENNIMY